MNMLLQTAISTKHASWANGRSRSFAFTQTFGYNKNWSRFLFLSACWVFRRFCYFDTNWRI